VIIGTGENRSFNIIVQYSLEYQKEKSDNFFLFFILSVILIIGTSLFGFLFFHKKKKFYFMNIKENTLTDRQKEIVMILKKHKRPMTQKKVQDLVDMPKSSLSRNIDSLVRRDIVRKEQKGMSNVLTLNTLDSSDKFR
jgi:uncharacterized membrane protein